MARGQNWGAAWNIDQPPSVRARPVPRFPESRSLLLGETVATTTVSWWPPAELNHPQKACVIKNLYMPTTFCWQYVYIYIYIMCVCA